MHSDETIDVCAPFWAFPGAHGHLGSAVENHGNDDRKLDGGGGDAGAAVAKQTSSGNDNNNNNKESNAVQHRFDGIMDVDGGGGSDVSFGGLAGEVEEHIADNVDGFLDDFLAFAGDGGGGGDGDIAEEDLDWLKDMDLAAFLPPPAVTAATAASSDAAADRDGPLPSPVHEIEPPVPAVMVAAEGGAASTPVPAPVPAAAPAAVAAVGVTMSLAGAAPAVAPPMGSDTSGMNGDDGRGGLPIVGACAAPGAHFGDNGGGGGGPGCAAEVSPKEQLRRQKVARYLEKKKRRRSTKACSYQSRQRVANARPRHKGRFLPLESEFVPIAELQRRQRALVKEMRDKAAALATATAAVSGDATMLSPEFGQRVAV